LFRANGARIGEDLFLAFSPERIDPGNPSFKVGISQGGGGVTSACTRLAAALYGRLSRRYTRSRLRRSPSWRSSTKTSFRNVNIALANEFALMCRCLGVSTREVIDAAATKALWIHALLPRPGDRRALHPGRSPLSLLENAAQWLRGSVHRPGRRDQTAQCPPTCWVLVSEVLNDAGLAVKGARILVLGAAYKRGIGDTRESPAHEIIATLRRRRPGLLRRPPTCQPFRWRGPSSGRRAHRGGNSERLIAC